MNPELDGTESRGVAKCGNHAPPSECQLARTEHAAHSSTDLRVYFLESVPQFIVISKHSL